MASSEFSWAVPMMRAGYAGRGLVYLVVAGFSLYAIYRGGNAEGTSSALSQLETTAWGGVVLVLIFLGMLAYAVWRGLDAAYDLEDYGRDGEGAIARIGMVTTGVIHLAIGVLAASLLFTDGGGGGGSGLARYVATVMGWPGGRWLVGIAGLLTIGAGIYYGHKGWTESYRKHLRGNEITRRWNSILKAGVIAQGIVVAIIGGLFVYAAFTANPNEAGGLESAFSWLSQQAYGRTLVAALCIGLLGFAVFCFVNAAHRIVPKVAGDDTQTLAAMLRG